MIPHSAEPINPDYRNDPAHHDWLREELIEVKHLALYSAAILRNPLTAAQRKALGEQTDIAIANEKAKQNAEIARDA